MTASAFRSSNADLDLNTLVKKGDCVYEPEIFPTAVNKREGITLSCFTTGKIDITGIKRLSGADGIIYPTILELELNSRKAYVRHVLTSTFLRAGHVTSGTEKYRGRGKIQ